MVGTNHDQRDEDGDAGGPVVVLVAPQMGENIGAAARAMWNFGLDQLRLVAPRDGWPNPRANALASGAGRVLDAARVYDTTAAACADLTLVFATTARDRNLNRRVLAPERAMAEARLAERAGARVGILFGPERAGLENADMVRSHATISIPVNPAFGSLNLGQSVLLVAYEWRRGRADLAAEIHDLAGASPATGSDLDRFFTHLSARLDAAGYFFPEQKRAGMLASLESLLRRAPISDADVRMLHGIVRTLAERSPGKGL